MAAARDDGGAGERLAAAVAGFTARVGKVAPDDLSQPTPCTEWVVGQLVNHVVGELLWMPPMLEGRTIAEIGDRLDGDHIGSDAGAAWDGAADAALRAVAATDPAQVVHLSYGDVPAAAYVGEVAIDVLIHTWDLARALGVDEQLDPQLVAAALARLEGHEDELAASGLFAPARPVAADADPQTRLLAAVGR